MSRTWAVVSSAKQLRQLGGPRWTPSCTPHARMLHATARRQVVKPFLLADIGEGIRECQVIQWFVQPGARVEQFDKLCEVQSDKASVEITSRFDGVIKKLHYEADDMAIVGKPLVDIDILSEISPEDEALTAPSPDEAAADSKKAEQQPAQTTKPSPAQPEPAAQTPSAESKKPSGRYATLATPAVRHLTKELDVNIADVQGTGKDGRVLKEDVHKYATARSNGTTSSSPAPSPSTSQASSASADRTIPLTPIQAQMFKAMTRSLTIPHFLYTDSIDIGPLTSMRRRLNSSTSTSSSSGAETKLSALAFIVKAASLALANHPILNARIDIALASEKPQLTYRGAHNIGIAVDSPNGLVVPVIKHVESKSIADVAAEIKRLAGLAQQGKLSSADMSGATFTVSNVGSIGGQAVAPVIVEGQVGIMAVGKARVVPAFAADGVSVVKREELLLSWSADHRVVDGATVARCAEDVRSFLEAPENMLVRLR